MAVEKGITVQTSLICCLLFCCCCCDLDDEKFVLVKDDDVVVKLLSSDSLLLLLLLQVSQNTQSHVSQNNSSCSICIEHLGINSRGFLLTKSNNWFTRKEGGNALIPPLGIAIFCLQMGHLIQPASAVLLRVGEDAINSRQL